LLTRKGVLNSHFFNIRRRCRAYYAFETKTAQWDTARPFNNL